MTDETVERQVADALYDHEWEVDTPHGHCKCGWQPTGKRQLDGPGNDHVDHQAAILMERFDIRGWGQT